MSTFTSCFLQGHIANPSVCFSMNCFFHFYKYLIIFHTKLRYRQCELLASSDGSMDAAKKKVGYATKNRRNLTGGCDEFACAGIWSSMGQIWISFCLWKSKTNDLHMNANMHLQPQQHQQQPGGGGFICISPGTTKLHQLLLSVSCGGLSMALKFSQALLLHRMGKALCLFTSLQFLMYFSWVFPFFFSSCFTSEYE